MITWDAFIDWIPKEYYVNYIYLTDRRKQNTKYWKNCQCSKQSEIGSLMKGEFLGSKTKQDTKSWPQISWQIAVIFDTPLEENILKRFILNQHEFRQSSNYRLGEVRDKSKWKSVLSQVRCFLFMINYSQSSFILKGPRRVTVTCTDITLIQTQMMNFRDPEKKRDLLL